MDKKELLIIASLRKDSRRSLTRMSRDIRLPISTIHDKMQDYREGIIKKTTAILDFAKLGFKTRAYVLLKTEVRDKKPLLEYLLKSSSVNTLSKINNGYDFYAEMIFKEFVDAENFMEDLSLKYDVKKKEIFYSLEDFRREDFLSTPSMVYIS